MYLNYNLFLINRNKDIVLHSVFASKLYFSRTIVIVHTLTYKEKLCQQSGVNIHFSEAECYKIDNKNNKVYCRASKDKKLGGQEDFSIDYDYLVIAMGGRSNTFNTPGVQEHAHFLKVYIFYSSNSLYGFIIIILQIEVSPRRPILMFNVN